MTHDFIHTSLYCRLSRPLSENVIKLRGSGGGGGGGGGGSPL